MDAQQLTSYQKMRLILTREEFLAAQSRPKERVRKWIAFADELPPAGILVDTKVDTGEGAKLVQPMFIDRSGWLWTKDGEGVRHHPTHWAKREIEMFVVIEISSCTIQNLFVG